MSGSIIPPASAQWWHDHYGIDSLSDMEAVVDRVLPSLPFGNLGFNHLFAFEAYSGPYGPAGIAVALYLQRQGYTGDAGNVFQSALDSVINAATNFLEANPVTTLVIPNAFQVTIQAVNGDVAVDNVLGLVNASGTAAGAAAALKAAWEVSGGPADNLNAQYAITQYKAVDLSSPDGDIAVVESTKTGGGSGSISTAAACALISWNGSSRSRSTRGRLYYGPLGEGAINADGRTLDGTVASDLADIFTTFRGALSTSGYPLAVLSRVLSTSTLVTAQTVEPVIATQRRRIRGR